MAFGRTEKHFGLPGDNMVARFRFHLEMAARGSTRSLEFQIRSGMTVGGKAGYVNGLGTGLDQRANEQPERAFWGLGQWAAGGIAVSGQGGFCYPAVYLDPVATTVSDYHEALGGCVDACRPPEELFAFGRP